MKRLNLSGRAVAVVAAATLVGGLLGGCGPDKPTAAESKELTYWSMWKQGEDQQKVLQAAIDGFEKSSGVKVKVQWSGRDVLKQVAARLNAGDVPDLTDQDGASIAGNLGQVDGVQGLADVYATTIPGEGKKVSDVIPAGLVASYKTKAGEPFVVPYEVFGSTMWFDATKHPELASAPPKTWAEFVALLDGLKAKGRTPLALDGDVKSYAAYWTTWSVIRHGGPGTLAKAATDKSGASFDDPAFLAAAKDMEQLIKGGYLAKDFNGTKWPTQQNAWAAGKSPTDFLLMGTWAPSETGPQASPGFQYRSMPFPSVDGGKGNSAAEAGVIGFAVPAKAKHSDAAKKFIAYFMNSERLTKIATDANNLTPRADVKAPETLSDFAKELNAAGPNVFLPSDNVSAVAPQWTSNVWEPANADFFNGKLDAAGFVKRLKDESVKLGKQG